MEANFRPTCQHCSKEFNDACVPRNLSCGHAFCKPCVAKLVPSYDGENVCPKCQKGFTAYELEDLSINYPMLRISRICSLKKLEQESLPPLKKIKCQGLEKAQENLGICPEHNHGLFFICLSCIEAVCRGCLAEKHPNPPVGGCTIASFQEGMNKLKDTFYKGFENFFKESEQMENNSKGMFRLFAKMLHMCHGTVEKHTHKIHEPFIKEIQKENDALLVKVSKEEEQRKKIETVLIGIKESKTPKDLKNVIADGLKVEEAYKKFRSERKTTKDSKFVKQFASVKKGTWKFVELGTPLYAVQNLKNKTRVARIHGRDNKVFLYSLQDGKPPKEGIHLPYELVRSCVPLESPTIFMDWEGAGEYKESACFQIYGNTARGRQAVLLCSGERGPSYRKTDFYELYSHEDDDSCLKGGDYEHNDGTGGRAIVDGITDGGVYTMPIVGGLMVGWPAAEKYKLGGFRLYSVDYEHMFTKSQMEDIDNIEFTAHHAFAMVTEGKDFICDILGTDQGDEFEDSKVMDCGLILDV